MLKLGKLKYFINTRFRDEIIDVQPPRENWVEHHGILVMESYVVTLVYKYAGPKPVAFDIEEEEEIDEDFFKHSRQEQERLRILSQNRTRKSAQDFYMRTLAQVQQKKQQSYER